MNSGNTYTGVGYHTPKIMRGLWSEPQGAPFEALKAAVELATERNVQLGSWRFATDGPCFSLDAGIPTYGFGPGDEAVAHSSSEHVPVDDLIAAARAYALLGMLV
jgi:acetylornithine deacetylase/succinyl-diaminopimelate desuccinylase-like protein